MGYNGAAMSEDPVRPAVPRASRRRTLLVTGSASGIGAAVWRRFERSGTRVVGIDLRDADVTADLSDPAQRIAAMAAVAELVGGRLDGAVVCAGLGPQTAPTDRIARVNYFGAIEVLDAALALLEEGEAPAAVAIASNSAGLTPARRRSARTPAGRGRGGGRGARWRSSTAPRSTA